MSHVGSDEALMRLIYLAIGFGAGAGIVSATILRTLSKRFEEKGDE